MPGSQIYPLLEFSAFWLAAGELAPPRERLRIAPGIEE
jgi:hypothetical protein